MGSDIFGQFGNGKYMEKILIKMPHLVINFATVVMEDGRLFTWGQNDSGQLGDGYKGSGDFINFRDFQPNPVLIFDGEST
jgi:alpha-tubulin suppressor-like RCC1 family protein